MSSLFIKRYDVELAFFSGHVSQKKSLRYSTCLVALYSMSISPTWPASSSIYLASCSPNQVGVMLFLFNSLVFTPGFSI